MKAITLWQPWATLLAVGAKRYETRSWSTRYRGPLAIHAAKTFPKEEMELCFIEPFKSSLQRSGFFSTDELPRGAVVGIADLVECLVVTEDFIRNIANTIEYDYGDYELGRYAWVLDNVRMVRPMPISGRQGLWNWEPNDEPEDFEDKNT